MLYHLYPFLSENVDSFFNLLRYITLRSAGAVVTSILIAFLLGPRTIAFLQRLKVGEVIRQEGPQTHLVKQGTPTMGGLLILISATISTLLWAQLTNWYVVLALVSLLWMGLIGFVDDYLKVVKKKSRGLIARYKLIGQLSFGAFLGLFLILNPITPEAVSPTATSLPFLSNWEAVFRPGAYVLFTSLVITGTSNAVNLTDGLDGLAAGLAALATATFGVFAYLIGRVDTSSYLGLFYLPGSGELTIFAVALGGAAIGFLWFNAYPAQVFMGDTGSLALGGAIGVLAILLKTEFLLLIVGGVFVAEALSVMIQTSYYKYSRWRFGEGRRVFRMAPIHHHFELGGWPETKVVIRFWILGVFCAMLAFSTLKIR